MKEEDRKDIIDRINKIVQSDVTDCILFGRDWIEDTSLVYSRLDVEYHPAKESTDIFGILYLNDRLLPAMPVTIRYWYLGTVNEETRDFKESDIRYRIKFGLIGKEPEKFDLKRSDVIVCEILSREEIEGGINR